MHRSLVIVCRTSGRTGTRSTVGGQKNVGWCWQRPRSRPATHQGRYDGRQRFLKLLIELPNEEHDHIRCASHSGEYDG